jgi:hypothetical protein
VTSDQRGKIEEMLWHFEAGQFQQFMLAYLPIYDSNFEGIIRIGGTVGGKTIFL